MLTTRVAGKVTRYRQGVVVEFQVVGKIRMFDPWHILLEIVATIVLLGACSTVTNVVAFYLIPNGVSSTLRTKRNEWVNRRGACAPSRPASAHPPPHLRTTL